jgi:hypothetical protein
LFASVVIFLFLKLVFWYYLDLQNIIFMNVLGTESSVVVYCTFVLGIQKIFHLLIWPYTVSSKVLVMCWCWEAKVPFYIECICEFSASLVIFLLLFFILMLHRKNLLWNICKHLIAYQYCWLVSKVNPHLPVIVTGL